MVSGWQAPNDPQGMLDAASGPAAAAAAAPAGEAHVTPLLLGLLHASQFGHDTAGSKHTAAVLVERQGECDVHEESQQPQQTGTAANGGDGQQMADDKPKRPAGTEQCPRCNSKNTKFCYYNNYNIKQPRYYCRVGDAWFCCDRQLYLSTIQAAY
jgi:hypothetical protein